MSMVTSCPACATTFRVTPDQLKARQGKVRCGQCRGVFDAFKTLASIPDEVVAEGGPGSAPGRVTEVPAAGGESRPMQAVLDIAPAPSVSRTAPHAELGSRTAPADGLGRSRARPGVLRAAKLGALAVLALLLVVQLTYALRAQIATAMPQSRPLLERLCAWAGCQVPAPRRTDFLAIESSDLQLDPLRAGVIVLTAAVRNRGASAVAHPALELTLTNSQDQPVARRVFLPEQYLERPQEASAGMRAHSELNVRIELDTGELKPAGYKLFLFYP